LDTSTRASLGPLIRLLRRMWTQTAHVVLFLSAVGRAHEAPVARECNARTSMLAAESSLLQARFENLPSFADGKRRGPLEAADESPVDMVCESPCTFGGATHSCRERVLWLVNAGGSTVAAAVDTVSRECDGQCMCSPVDVLCDSRCMFEGVTASCRERVQWLVGEGGSTVVAALDTVSQECSEQCMCGAADFGVQEDLSTTAMLVSSPEPTLQGSTTPQSTSEAADETTSTTAAEVNSSEPVQGTPSTSSSGAVSTTTQSSTLTPGASCRFSVVFCNGYSGGPSGEDTTTPPPPQNWELMVGECNPDGRGGAYRVDKPPNPNPFETECGTVSPYYVHVEHYPEENCTSAKDDSSFTVFTDGYCGICCDINTHVYNSGKCCDINTGVCSESRCAGFLSPA